MELEKEDFKTGSRTQSENKENGSEKEKKKADNEKKGYKLKKYGTFLLLATFSILFVSLVFLAVNRPVNNPVFLYIRGVFPDSGQLGREKEIQSKRVELKGESSQSFIEKQEEYKSNLVSVSDLYFNRLLATPLSKMTLTIPINNELIRSYQIRAIDYNKNNEMTFHLSLQHSLRINNDTMKLYDENMGIINELPNDASAERKQDLNQDSFTPEGKLRKNEEGRRLQQQEYYNYTSTTEWNHKPQVVNNIIPTYYPRNPYIPPYGNPYYYAPNILVPFVYIY